MDENVQGLIQTIVILVACVVYLTKQIAEAYKKKKNGHSHLGSCRAGDVENMIFELHQWHRPVTDQETGQPRFMWYENNLEFQKQLERNRSAMEALSACMRKTRESIDKLNATIADSKGG
jgi:hypothetical protein